MHRVTADWRRISQLLDVALDLPVERREEWLDTLSPEHEALRPVLREMLFGGTGRLRTDALDKPPDVLTALLDSHAQRSAQDGELREGVTVGPYRLEKEVGRGGMGAVWLATRDDDQLRRRVALKFPYPGPDARQRIERLLHERDILARLEHPNIARLYDADVTSHPLPFLVLEYVDGEPFGAWCDRHELPLRQRLVIFLQVLNAVKYAHARLVIHRDIKPSNILVTADGVVRLLDFGIAKITSDGAAQETALTQYGGRVLTPEYASPEQLSGGSITTASDLYSLGVILCELLCGSRPYQVKNDSRAALESAIASARIAPPSRLAITPEAAANRGLGVESLRRTLRGDLDAIVEKALRAEPDQRYVSADTFSQDIRDYLDGRTVSARAGTVGYRVRKYVARHRLAVAASAGLVLAIGAGGLVAYSQAIEARKQRDQVLKLLARNQAVTDFMGLVIMEAASANEAMTIPQLVARSERMVLEGKHKDPEETAALLLELATYYSSFGDMTNAERLLKLAGELATDSADSSLRAILTCRHAYVRSRQSGEIDASAELARGLEAARGDPMATTICLQLRAFVSQNSNDPAGALASARMALEELRASTYRAPLLEADLLADIGYGHALSGESAEAHKFYSEAWQRLKDIGRGESSTAVTLLNNWGIADISSGDLRGALQRLDEAIAIANRRAGGGDPPTYLLGNRALAQERLHLLDAASADWERTLELARKHGLPQLEAGAIAGLGRIHVLRNELAAARDRYDAVATKIGKEIAPGSPSALNTLALEGLLAKAEGRPEDARVIFTKILDTMEQRKLVVGTMVTVLRERALLSLKLGDVAAATADAERALTLARRFQADKPSSLLTGFSLLAVAEAHAAAGRRDLVLRFASQAETELLAAAGEHHPDTIRARELLGRN